MQKIADDLIKAMWPVLLAYLECGLCQVFLLRLLQLLRGKGFQGTTSERHWWNSINPNDNVPCAGKLWKELPSRKTLQDFQSGALLDSHWMVPSSLNHSCCTLRMTTASSPVLYSCLQHILLLLFADLFVLCIFFLVAYPASSVVPHCGDTYFGKFVCLRIIREKVSIATHPQ